MKRSVCLVQGLIFLGTGLGLMNWNSTTLAQSQNKYTCETVNNIPTTFVYNIRGKIELIKWLDQWASASGYTPERRCQIVTERFQQYSDQGQLKYVTTGYSNGYPIICVADFIGNNKYKCKPDGILLTLKKDDNGYQVLQSLFDLPIREYAGAIVRGRVQDTVNIDILIEKSQTVSNQNNSSSPPSQPPTQPLKPEPPSSQGGQGLVVPEGF